jgi:outer membrane protein OmpA-like peptidoglycan-associated protein
MNNGKKIDKETSINIKNLSQQSPEVLDRLVNLLIELETTESITDDIEVLSEMFESDEFALSFENSKPIKLSIVDRPNFFENPEVTQPEKIDQTPSLEIPKDDRVETKEREFIKQAQEEAKKNNPEDPEKILETANAVNALIPLMVELLHSKIDFSKDTILEAVAPEIDRLIERRVEEDGQRIGAAIAHILPEAIGIEIRNSPQEIAKAIAPEVAAAIQEQIRLDRNSISSALGSEMGRAIKNQIELERDAMVDALYPVIGNTVSKYMVDVVKNINNKVEQALTPEGIKRKIRAKMRGISEAELILQESVSYEVQAIFLIHKASGLIIEEVQSLTLERKLESDLLAGMLTAIRSFVNDCISLDRTSELNQIEYGDVKIILEVGGYCYLAAIVKGEPSKKFIANIRETLSQIIMQHGDAIEAYDGDPRIIPSTVQTSIYQLLKNETIVSQNKKPTALLILLGLILLGFGIPWGISQYRQNFANRITATVNQELDAAPELSVYRLIPTVQDGKLILTGRVGSEYLKTQAETIAKNIAIKEKLSIDNQIVAVDVPFDPTLAKAEIQRTTNLINQRQGVAIVTNYQPKTLTISGVVQGNRGLEQITQAFRHIPSVDTIILQTSPKLPQINQRIYFESSVTTVKTSKINSTLREIASILQQNPQLHLKIIGHADASGEESKNRQLKEKRAANIKVALAELGIGVDQLLTLTSDQLPPLVSDRKSLALSRCVRFELFIPEKPDR